MLDTLKSNTDGSYTKSSSKSSKKCIEKPLFVISGKEPLGRPRTSDNPEFPIKPTMQVLFRITGVTQKNKLAAILGVTPSAIGREKKNFSSERILKFAKDNNYSIEQIRGMVADEMKGETPVGDKESLKEKGTGAEVKIEAVSILSQHMAIPNLRRISKRSVIMASTELDKEWVLNHFGEHWNQLAVYMMDSDNMAPLIQPGDFLLVDTGVKSIDGSGVYAFRTEDGDMVFYRVHKRFDGDIDIFSENRSYPGEHINPKRIPEVAGRVVKILKDPY